MVKRLLKRRQIRRKWSNNLLRRSPNGLSRKSQQSIIEMVRQGIIGVLSRSAPETEQNPGKMIIPLSMGSPSMESSLEAAMKYLGLWMISSSGMMRNIEQGAHMGPESRGELRTHIRSDMRGYS